MLLLERILYRVQKGVEGNGSGGMITALLVWESGPVDQRPLLLLRLKREKGL